MRRCLALVTLLACAASAAAEELRNWFNDPFAQATYGEPACPPPLGPLMTREDAQRAAHGRVERGTSCWLAGRCASPNAYLNDAAINAAVVEALARDPQLRRSAIWVHTQRKFVFLQGCAPDRASAARAVTLARQIPQVEYVGDELMLGTRGKPPYPLAPR